MDTTPILFSQFFTEYMPHGHCYGWTPSILWINVIADLFIAAAYFSIPVALCLAVYNRPHTKFRALYVLFALFILSCGMTHLLGIYTIWFGVYGLQGIVKALTAIVSFATAVLLFIKLPAIIALPSPTEYKKVLQKNHDEQLLREKMQIEIDLNRKLQPQIDRFNRIINSVNDGLWEWNLTTKELWWSESLQQMVYSDPESTPNYDNWHSHIHPEDVARVDQHLQQHLDLGTPYNIFYRGQVSAKEYQWMHARGSLIIDEITQHKIMYGVQTNVNEIRGLTVELEQKSRYLAKVLDSVLCGVYIFNFSLQTNTYVNAEYTKLLGYTAVDLESFKAHKTFYQLFHPDDAQKIQSHHSALQQQTNNELSIKYRIKHKLGHWVWCHSRDFVYTWDNNGQVETVLGAFFDISDLVYKEAQLQRAAAHYQATFEDVALGICHLSLNGEFIRVNRKLCELIKCTQSEVMQKNFFALCNHEEQETQYLLENLFKSSSAGHSEECQLVTHDGNKIWIQVTPSRAQDLNSGGEYYIVVIEDVTDRKLSETRLAESNQALERFAYAASHDLQEPLRKICSFSERLSNRLNTQGVDETSIFELNRIHSAAKRMSGIIRSLLELSRVNQRQLKPQWINCSKILAIVCDDLSRLIANKQATINLETNFKILGDANILHQLFLNIIKNAIEYSREEVSPIINIDLVETETEYYSITIEDNGIGFENKYAHQLFEPFKRFASKKEQGYGMGLAICAQLAKGLNAKLYAHPKLDKDCGAVFGITVVKSIIIIK